MHICLDTALRRWHASAPRAASFAVLLDICMISANYKALKEPHTIMAAKDRVLGKIEAWEVILESNTNELGTIIQWRIFEQVSVHLKVVFEAQ